MNELLNCNECIYAEIIFKAPALFLVVRQTKLTWVSHVPLAKWIQWPLYLNGVKRGRVEILRNHSCQVPRDIQIIRQNKLIWKTCPGSFGFEDGHAKLDQSGQEDKSCTAEFVEYWIRSNFSWRQPMKFKWNTQRWPF